MGLELKDDKLVRTGLPDAALNALGIPAPNRTDFKNWSRENLEAFARQAADENLVLRTNNKALHEAWRQAVKAS